MNYSQEDKEALEILEPRAQKLGYKIYFPRNPEGFGIWWLITIEPEDEDVEKRLVKRGTLGEIEYFLEKKEKEAADARKAIQFDQFLLINRTKYGTFSLTWRNQHEGTAVQIDNVPDLETGLRTLLDRQDSVATETLKKFRQIAEDKNWDYDLL
jgi:hypothetical protein